MHGCLRFVFSCWFAEMQKLFSLVCVTVAGSADNTSIERVENDGRLLCTALYSFLGVDPFPEVIKVRTFLTYPIDSVKFIISLPYKWGFKLFSCWFDPEKASFLQRICSVIAFSGPATDKPIRSITDKLASPEWPFPWHVYYRPGMRFWGNMLFTLQTLSGVRKGMSKL